MLPSHAKNGLGLILILKQKKRLKIRNSKMVGVVGGSLSRFHPYPWSVTTLGGILP